MVKDRNNVLEISIIICTYNRVHFLQEALDSIKNQNYSMDAIEIIVVDNNSTDNTRDFCNKYIIENEEMNINYFLEEKKGLSNARNCGINNSSAEILTFIDDDAVLQSNFVERVIMCFGFDSEIDAIGGKVLPVFKDVLPPKWLSKYLYGLLTIIDFGEKRKTLRRKYPAGCNMSFRRKVFNDLGGFNPDLIWRNDDKYIFQKLFENRRKVVYDPQIVVNHNIEAARLEAEYLNRLIFFIGHSEKIRLNEKLGIAKIIKILEYFFKFIAAIILAIPFILKSEPKKGTFLIYVRWKIFKSFFQ